MKPPFRPLLPTVLVLAAGLRPGLAAEPERSIAGMEWWRLRSADVVVTGSTTPSAPRRSPVTEIPETRRAVRVVYPGLSAAR